MRRKDREVTDNIKIENIIKKCTSCRIGFNDNGNVYIVPMNFGYEKKNNSYILYFHSAGEGRKINLISKNPNVGFEMDTDYGIKEADIACDYTAFYQSIIGNGTVKIIDEMDEKIKGLNLIMEHNTGKNSWNYNEKMLNVVTVFKIEVENLSCKEHV